MFFIIIVDFLNCGAQPFVRREDPHSSLLTVFQLTDLAVLLLELLADLLHGDVVAERFGNLIDHLGCRVTRCTDVVTLNTEQGGEIKKLKTNETRAASVTLLDSAASRAKIENVCFKRFIIRVHLQKPNTGRSVPGSSAAPPSGGKLPKHNMTELKHFHINCDHIHLHQGCPNSGPRTNCGP